MNIQYNHHRQETYTDPYFQGTTIARGGTTIAMESVPVDMFLEMTVGDQLEVEVGKAVCSKKDNYNRKLGREIAKGRMKNVVLDVIAASKGEIILSDGTNQYTLILSATGKKVFFLSYE
jgi:hypothetical protein